MPQRDTGPQLLLKDDEASPAEALDPQQQALKELAAHARQSEEPISLLAWKRLRDELTEVTDDAWLMFSCLQLKGGGFRLNFVQALELDPFPINEAFYDIEVRRPLLEAA